MNENCQFLTYDKLISIQVTGLQIAKKVNEANFRKLIFYSGKLIAGLPLKNPLGTSLKLTW